ncbi:hypothetical protein JCM3765_006449 [Sporobolomyces pararoseus]
MSYNPYSPGRTLGDASSTPSSPLRFQPPNEAAAIAALTRSVGSLSIGSDSSQPMFWERKEWQRLIDDEKEAIETLETIIKLVEGVKALPADSDGKERERTIRLRNKVIKRTIVDVPGAFDLLVQCGFKRTVVEMEERLTFPRSTSASSFSTAQSRLSTSLSILTSSLENLLRRSELEETSKEAAKEENERRMKLVLEEIKEDRQKHKDREARRKAAKQKASGGAGVDPNPVHERRDWY